LVEFSRMDEDLTRAYSGDGLPRQGTT